MFYPVNLQHSSCKYVFTNGVENSVDPGSTVFAKKDKSVLSMTRVKSKVNF